MVGWLTHHGCWVVWMGSGVSVERKRETQRRRDAGSVGQVEQKDESEQVEMSRHYREEYGVSKCTLPALKNKHKPSFGGMKRERKIDGDR